MTDAVETGTETAARPEEIVKSTCDAYASAVNASDSRAYSKLFTEDAIRMPPGTRAGS